jgi:hypothetical protein
MAFSDIMYSPVTVWVSDVGVEKPDESLAYGANWPTGWTNVGYTSAALTVELANEKQLKTVEQAPGPVGRIISNKELTIETVMAELTLGRLQYSWGGTLETVAAGVGQPGYEKLTIKGDACVTQRQWGFEGRYATDDECNTLLPVRFICVGDAEVGGSLEFARETQTGIPLRIEAIYQAVGSGYNLCEWLKVTAEALP